MSPLQDVPCWLETRTHVIDFTTGDTMGEANDLWPPLIYSPKVRFAQHPHEFLAFHRKVGSLCDFCMSLYRTPSWHRLFPFRLAQPLHSRRLLGAPEHPFGSRPVCMPSPILSSTYA